MLSFLLMSRHRIEGFSRAYHGQDLTLTLPEGKTIKEVRWLTVWNRGFSVRNELDLLSHAIKKSLGKKKS
jgi:hypothetical protein